MSITVNALGDVCPIPVVKTIKAINSLSGAGIIETHVDNETSVENLGKLAASKGFASSTEKIDDRHYVVKIEVGEAASVEESEADAFCPVTPKKKKNIVAVISSNVMGGGSDELGAALMKSFIYALSQQEELPTTILFYNGGPKLSTEESPTLNDLKEMESQGVEILTCGTCLNFYGLTEKLAVGSVTNMYVIVEKMTGADLIIKP